MNDLSLHRWNLRQTPSGRRLSLANAEDYIASLTGRNLEVYLFGERIDEPVDHPIIRPSINAMAESYKLALAEPELATAWSSISERSVNRFLHIPESPQDLGLPK